MEPGGDRWLAPGLKKCKCVFHLSHENQAAHIQPSSNWWYIVNRRYIVTCCLHQIPVNSQWTPTQYTERSNCLPTTGRWPVWRRISHILIIQTDLMTALSCCVEVGWPVALTGRSSGVEKFLYPWGTKESEGEETVTTVGLEGTISPGDWNASVLMDTLSGITTEKQTSPGAPPPAPPLAELQCMWTVLLALCLSTKSPMTHWSTCTPSTLLSLNLFILGLGSGSGLGLCLCVLCRRESLLLSEENSPLQDRHKSQVIIKNTSMNLIQMDATQGELYYVREKRYVAMVV